MNIFISECFAPFEITISDVLYIRLFSLFNFLTTACFKASVPDAGVYFVIPFSRASIAACFIWSGVSKSGSPVPKPTASKPSAFIALNFESIAKGGDAETRLPLLLILIPMIIIAFLPLFCKVLYQGRVKSNFVSKMTQTYQKNSLLIIFYYIIQKKSSVFEYFFKFLAKKI